MGIAPEADSRSLLQFFMMSGRLKSEMRRGWVKKLGMARPESVADHSYRTALITMVFSDTLGLDTGKALRLALLHDLPEAIVGDAMPEERSGKRKIEMETKAMEEILSELSEEQRALYRRGVAGVHRRQDAGGPPGAGRWTSWRWRYRHGSTRTRGETRRWRRSSGRRQEEQVQDAGLLEILRQVEP